MKSCFLTLGSSFDFSVLDFVLGGLVKMVKKVLTNLEEITSLSYSQPWVAYESRNMNREQEILNIAGLMDISYHLLELRLFPLTFKFISV